MKEQIESVIKTLQQLEIRASYENMTHLLGCLQTLAQVLEELGKEESDVCSE